MIGASVTIAVLAIAVLVMGSLLKKQAVKVHYWRTLYLASDETLTDALEGKKEMLYEGVDSVRVRPKKLPPWEGFEEME